MPQVMVLSSEGYFYSYNIDLENGGECSLMKQYRYASSLAGRSVEASDHAVRQQPARLERRDK